VIDVVGAYHFWARWRMLPGDYGTKCTGEYHPAEVWALNGQHAAIDTMPVDSLMTKVIVCLNITKFSKLRGYELACFLR